MQARVGEAAAVSCLVDGEHLVGVALSGDGGEIAEGRGDDRRGGELDGGAGCLAVGIKWLTEDEIAGEIDSALGSQERSIAAGLWGSEPGIASSPVGRCGGKMSRWAKVTGCDGALSISSLWTPRVTERTRLAT